MGAPGEADDLRKYPRTRHLEGSRFQPGDEDLASVPFAELAGRPLVVEEKVDGANVGIAFDGRGELRLQSRGHHLRGGGREEQFDLFKTWARTHAPAFEERLGARYVVYGEWLYAKHTVFYDLLPHYFLEFDVLDRERDVFLGTPERRALLAGLPVASVSVLWSGTVARRAAPPSKPAPRVASLEDLRALIGPSLAKSPAWRAALEAEAATAGVPLERAWTETDRSDLMEGLYLKVEEGGVVTDRFKLVRADFLQAILASGTHWQDRRLVPNRLREGVDLFAPELAP